MLAESPRAAWEANVTQRIGISGITGRMGQLLAEEIPVAGAVLSGGIRRPESNKPAPAGRPCGPIWPRWLRRPMW